MKINKKILYLDSDIVAKASMLMKLLLFGDDEISITEVIAFNKKWAYTITKELDYDQFHTVPKSNMISALERFCYFDSSSKTFKLNPLALKNILATFENYRNELSANKMYLSVYDNLLESIAKTIKEKTANLVYQKLERYVLNNFTSDSSDKYSTTFSSHEMVGKLLLMHAEILFEKKLGFNYEFSVPSEDMIREDYNRLLVQERSFVRMIEDDNLSAKELELIAKVIREKKFTLSRQLFIHHKMKPSAKPLEITDEVKNETKIEIDAAQKNVDEFEIDLNSVLGEFEKGSQDAIESINEVLKSTEKLLDENIKIGFDE